MFLCPGCGVFSEKRYCFQCVRAKSKWSPCRSCPLPCPKKSCAGCYYQEIKKSPRYYLEDCSPCVQCGKYCPKRHCRWCYNVKPRCGTEGCKSIAYEGKELCKPCHVATFTACAKSGCEKPCNQAFCSKCFISNKKHFVLF
jgi:hypothetical protein